MEVSERAKVNIIIDALDNVAPRKNFIIPKVWEEKKCFSDDIRVAADRRDVTMRM